MISWSRFDVAKPLDVQNFGEQSTEFWHFSEYLRTTDSAKSHDISLFVLWPSKCSDYAHRESEQV
jgi:hypothetical protein